MPKGKKQKEKLCKEIISDEVIDDVTLHRRKKNYVISYSFSSDPKTQRLLKIKASNEEFAWNEALKKLCKEGKNKEDIIKKYITCID